jgi:5-hydroxyisourate hydrolase
MSKEVSRREFLSAGMMAGAMPYLLQTANAADSPATATSATTGRLTFHGIDTHNGATIGILRADLSVLDGGKYRLLRSFDTLKGGRSDGALLEGAALTAGHYEILMNVDEYYSKLGTSLPVPNFLSQVPVRFAISDASQRYHVAVLFSPGVTPTTAAADRLAALTSHHLTDIDQEASHHGGNHDPRTGCEHRPAWRWNAHRLLRAGRRRLQADQDRTHQWRRSHRSDAAGAGSHEDRTLRAAVLRR